MNDKKDIPENDRKLIEWLNNFLKISSNATLLGIIRPAEISVLTELISDVIKDLKRDQSLYQSDNTKFVLGVTLDLIDRMKKYPDFKRIKLGENHTIEYLKSIDVL